MAPEEVEAAVAKWLRENGLAAHRVARKKLHESDSLSKLWAGYQRQAKIKKKGGARRIRDIILGMPPGRLFQASRSTCDRVWRGRGLGVSMHDLRRASCLYLGRVVRIPRDLLKEHARHEEEEETTSLYTRKPKTPGRKKPVGGTEDSDVG